MTELRLNGKSEEGTHLSLHDNDGNEFTVRISDTLRATVNQPRLSAVPEQEAVPSEQITESFTWVVAGMPLGGAISSALGGWVIDTYGAQSALWVPLGFMCAALLATLPYFRVYKRLIHYPLNRD